MWDVLITVLKKAAKYGAVAFTGYEIGEQLESNKNSQQIVKETTIIKEKAEPTNDTWVIIIAFAFFAIIAASTVQLVKCATKRNSNNNTANAMIQLEAQAPTQQPQAARRQ